MLALIRDIDGAVRLAEREARALEPGLARLSVTATGVCGTDLHIAAGEYACEPPVTMGHEISGYVREVGSAADAAWIGRQVVCETYYSTCGTCRQCRDGRRNLCPKRRSLGSFEDGGFADSVVVPVLNLHAVPEAIDAVSATLAEPLACVAQCLLDPAVVEPGDRVLVLGPGAMGLLAAQVAMACGGQVTVTGLESDTKRLEWAASRGASISLDPRADSFDTVIECSGAAPAVAAALRSADRGARVVQVGIVGRAVELPLDMVLYKELSVTSGFASTPRSWRRALALLAEGRISFDGLITHQFHLSEWKRAFAMVGSPEAIKVALLP